MELPHQLLLDDPLLLGLGDAAGEVVVEKESGNGDEFELAAGDLASIGE